MSEISLKSHLPIPEAFRERNSITSKDCLLNPYFWKQKSPLKQLKIKVMVDCLQGIWAVFCGHSIAKATAPWSQHCVNNNWASIQGSVHPVLTLIRNWLHPPEALNFLGDYFSFRFMYTHIHTHILTHMHTQKENPFQMSMMNFALWETYLAQKQRVPIFFVTPVLSYSFPFILLWSFHISYYFKYSLSVEDFIHWKSFGTEWEHTASFVYNFYSSV